MVETMFSLRLTTLQRRFLTICTVLAVCWALGFRFLVSEQPTGAKPVYYGTTGPYLVNAEGLIAKETDEFRPGDRIGWMVSICYEPGTTGEAVTDLVDRRDNKIVNTIITPLPVSEVPCADKTPTPRMVVRVVPLDIAPGSYEMRRRLLLGAPTDPHRAVIEVIRPFIAFRVVKQ
jgi:hypothetical protein